MTTKYDNELVLAPNQGEWRLEGHTRVVAGPGPVWESSPQPSGTWLSLQESHGDTGRSVASIFVKSSKLGDVRKLILVSLAAVWGFDITLNEKERV